MKINKFIWFFIISHTYPFNDPIIFQPVTDECQKALTTCFERCLKKPINELSQCQEKRTCLNRCNFKLIKSMRPEKCYQKCEDFRCNSPAYCTMNCFKRTPDGTCRKKCRQAKNICTQQCPDPKSNDRFRCLNCCYTQAANCEKRCCQ